MLNLSYKKLEVYAIAMKLAKEVYKVTKAFPTEKRYALVTQLRRASVSVCNNLAEVAARTSKDEKRLFLEIARSSIVEIGTQIEIALMLQLVEMETIKPLENYAESVFIMLSKMMDKRLIATTD